MSNVKNQLKVTVLGCGGSGGVPYITGYWGECDPDNPKNHRLRPSILLQKGETSVVIDTGPDFRQQMLRLTNWNKKINAVLYTHAHADHIMGLDDLRAVRFVAGEPVSIYSDARTLRKIKKHFDFAFEERMKNYPPMAEAHELPKNGKLEIGELEIEWFYQDHGQISSIGYRIGDFAYCTDVKAFPKESFDKLYGIKQWIVDGLPYEAKQHAHIDEVKQWVEQLKPEMTYLTHMNAGCDYETLCQSLPDNVRPAYDGLELYI